MNDIILKNENGSIYLRPITEEDTDEVLRWRNSPHVVNYFIYRKPITKEEHIRWIREKVNTGLVEQFIICSKADDKMLGCIYLQKFMSEHRLCESGIFLSDEAAGMSGIGTQAEELILDYAKNVLKLHKVVAQVLSYNMASRALHEKVGYVCEGCLKEHYFLDGKYCDLYWYARFLD